MAKGGLEEKADFAHPAEILGVHFQDALQNRGVGVKGTR